MGKPKKSTAGDGLPKTPYFYLPDFGRTQHYMGIDPTWIKLHRDILNNDAFISLEISARHAYFCLLLIAAARNNVIPNDRKYLKKMMRTDTEPDIKPLFDCGLLLELNERGARDMLSGRHPASMSEKRRLRLEQTDKKEKRIGDARGKEEEPEERSRWKNEKMDSEKPRDSEKRNAENPNFPKRGTVEDAVNGLAALRQIAGMTPRGEGFQAVGGILKK